jgi:hypothetical protein
MFQALPTIQRAFGHLNVHSVKVHKYGEPSRHGTGSFLTLYHVTLLKEYIVKVPFCSPIFETALPFVGYHAFLLVLLVRIVKGKSKAVP